MKIRRFNILLWRMLSGVWLSGLGMHALANPTGMTVASGAATASQNGRQLTVTTSQNAFLNWQSFNIASGETTIFNQPSIYSLVVNRINDPNPSQIYGSLQANGIVVLMNSSGFYFGPNSYVKTGGLIVSTANCIPPQNTGGSWEFNGPPPLSTIANFGKIDVGSGGPAYLIAENVLNYGSITAPDGDIGLAAGQQVVLSDRPDGRGLSMQVNLPDGSVDNYGHITADAGTIAMNARTVNQDGIVQANSVRNENGVIELVASDKLNLGANSQILANGDDSAGGSSGGSVTLKSGNTFSDATGSQIDVTGGSQGGDGGNVEISAPSITSLNTHINGQAQLGWVGGTFLLDPDYIVLNQSGGDTLNISGSSGSLLAGNSPGDTLYLNVGNSGDNYLDSAFLGLSQITLQAKHDITLASGTTWSLSDSTGTGTGQLLLEAGNNIIFQDGSAIVDANNWSVSLFAGVDFTSPTLKVVPVPSGNTDPSINHSIYLDGGDGVGGSIQTASGSINLSAGNGIQIGSGTVSSGGGNITWQSGGDIQFGDGSSIFDGNNGVVTLDAGYDFANNTVQVGVGSIYLNGGPNGDGVGGYIQTEAGDISLVAGQDITVGAGYVITTGGGSISAHALAGSIDTGSDAQGYVFANSASSLNAAYNLSGGLGGISTMAGGDVTLIAGGDVTSVLPSSDQSYYYDLNPVSVSGNGYLTAGSGAYGSQPGNVTIVAGGNVTGHYLAANGYGAIYAGAQMDANGNPIVAKDAGNNLITEKDDSGNPVKDASGNDIYVYALNPASTGSAGTDLASGGLALSLISGGWNVAAAQKISLQEVSNPNGVFNDANSYKHYFNYAPGDYVDLSAGNLVQLGASAKQLPRLSYGNPQNDVNNVPIIYPSILNIVAGTGGVILGASGSGSPSSLTLFPSPQGSLTIDTTGSLVSKLGSVSAPKLFNLIVSDAGHNQYTTTANFGAGDHAASPVHANALTPIYLNIGGDMDYLDLTVPEAAQITIGGNMNNCGFQGMNLSPDPSFQDQIYEADGSTRTVTVDPSLTSINVSGDIFNQSGFTSVDLSAYPYAQPDNAPGYIVGGGGQFDITAQTIDLGTSSGIQSAGVAAYTIRGSYPLRNLFGNGGVFDHGADITVTTTGNHSAGVTASGDLIGDLDMYSSSIASLDGGNISINAGGDVNVGSSVFTVNTSGATGIYSTSQGDVSVIANGDVNVNGSRITTYDGGNVTVESLNGSVNAGTGASQPVGVTGYYEDPVTHAVDFTSPQIPFSGILALTFPADPSYPEPPPTLGNIFIEAPNGSVNANAAGILQIPLNNLNYPNATTTVLAGYQLNNAGEPVFALSDRNIVTFGSTFQLTGLEVTDDKLITLNLTPLLEAGGAPALDAEGHQLYVDNLEVRGGPLITYSLNNGIISINPYLDAGGDPVSAVSLSGITDSHGNAVFVYGRNIDVKGSGLIASNAKLLATGDINGLIFARGNININAQQNINVTAFGIGNVNVSSSGGTISGTLIGVNGVSASGSSVDASLISANVSGTTSGQSGLGQGTAANGTSQGLANNESTQAAATADNSNDDQKKRGKQIALAQKVSRVTVILPPKNVSETQTKTPGT